MRILIAMLWIQNSAWKAPPDFGREAGRGLFKFTSFAVDHEVFAPFAGVVRTIVLPNFTFFGWMTLLVEASLGAFLLLGLATRFWAIVGIAQSLAITLSVLNAPHEWSWAYYMMIGAHVAILATAAGRTFGLDGVLRPKLSGSSRVTRILRAAS